MLEKVQLLDAVVRIFDNVNLINFITRTETSLKSLKKNSLSIDFVNQSHTVVNTRLQKYIIAEQHEQFMEFTNLRTLRERLICRNIISEDFISSESGWIRAQYITVSTDDNGLPSAVIYITRNVDSEKKKEAYLLEISMTDALTGMYNRRSYDKDKLAIKSSPLPENLVLFSMDDNNLKTVNDTLGHNIGDELIKNASRCLSAAIGPLGTVYRVGGDEFFAIATSDDPEKIRKDISELTKNYDGTYPNKLNISVGYASLRAHPEASFDELENLADVNMYEEKDRYYRENHIDRRRRRRASG